MSDIRCKYCDETFENKGLLMTHHRNGCPKKPPEGTPPRHVIPLAVCPPETAVLGKGRIVALRVMGRLTDEGVELDQVDLYR